MLRCLFYECSWKTSLNFLILLLVPSNAKLSTFQLPFTAKKYSNIVLFLLFWLFVVVFFLLNFIPALYPLHLHICSFLAVYTHNPVLTYIFLPTIFLSTELAWHCFKLRKICNFWKYPDTAVQKLFRQQRAFIWIPGSNYIPDSFRFYSVCKEVCIQVTITFNCITPDFNS